MDGRVIQMRESAEEGSDYEKFLSDFGQQERNQIQLAKKYVSNFKHRLASHSVALSSLIPTVITKNIGILVSLISENGLSCCLI